jgi:DegV family protein with EDD domain
MIKIVADTTSGLTPEEASRLGIYYIPQIIIFGEESYRDDTEINHKTFLEKLRISPTLPKTAAPPPELYKPIFEKESAAGNTIIVIAPSAELSGTYRSATTAALEYPDADIRIIDIRTLAGGFASIIFQAQEWAEHGMEANLLVEKIEDLARRNRIYFVVDTLEYLRKGGRIGGAQALVGSILQVKPILTLKDGRAEAAESQRTKHRAYARLVELIVSQYPKDHNGYLSVMHGDAEKDAIAMAELLAEKLSLDIKKIPIYDLPPAILVHAGPGVIAVSFIS